MKARRALLWMSLGAAAFGLQLWLGGESTLAERFFSRGLFVAFRWVWDYTLGLSPVPLFYVLLAAVAVGLGRRIVRRLRGAGRVPAAPRGKTIPRYLFAAMAWAGKLVFFFYVLWGFNYNRVGVVRQMSLAIAPLNAADLASEAAWATRSAAEARASISGAAAEVLSEAYLPGRLESSLREDMAAVLKEAGYPTPGRVRVRSFFPGGWMMRFSGTGIYVPFFGEGYTASNLLPHEKPFTMAHEMAHGFGITDEGEANFLAFLACRASDLPFVRYSGYLGYWEYTVGELARASREDFLALWETLPPGMQADLRAAQANAARYRGALERVSRRVYSRYLKAQGISDGMMSYSRFVGLVAAWKKKNG